MAGDDPEDGPRHGSAAERLSLVERDVRSHARSLTALSDASNTFSPQQLAQLRTVLREEFGNIGLRIDEDEHVDSAREDMRFLRRARLNWDGASKRVGNTVLGAIVAVLLAIAGAGFWAWLGKH